MSQRTKKKFPLLVLLFGISIGVVLTAGVSAAFPGSSIFGDVPAGHFADEAIGRMYELGVIKGRDSSHFDPNGSLTRAEAAVLMDRLYAAINGTKISSSTSSSWHSASPVSSTRSSSSSSSSSSSVQSVSSVYSFSATEYTAMENGGGVNITVVRTGETGQANVSYSTTSDTATSFDYGAAGGTLTFAAGEMSKTFTVTTKDNTNIEGSRKLSVSLSSPSAGGVIGSQGTATVVIFDDETMELSDISTFRFTASEFTMGRGTGYAYFTVKRSGSIGPASVSFETLPVTATPEVDYRTTSGVLNFAIGETVKSIAVQMTDVTQAASSTFQIQLKNPVSGTLSDLSFTTVTVN